MILSKKINKQTKILILCAGAGIRWGNYMGIPKQLIPINGESLLARMVRLLNKEGLYNIEIISNDKKLMLNGCGFFKPSKSNFTVETIRSTCNLWDRNTIILLGDVYYTKSTLKKITKNKINEIQIFGRPLLNKGPKFSGAEIFAISFNRYQHELLLNHIAIVCRNAENGGNGKLWDLFKSIEFDPAYNHMNDKNIFVPIRDNTNDFDSPEEYIQNLKKYNLFRFTNRMKEFYASMW